MKYAIALLAVAGLYIPITVTADDNTEKAVVVTATRVPTPIEQIGSSVSVITAEEIARKQWRTIADALASVPGLRVVQSGVPGTLTSVFTRGTNSNHTLVLIDGVKTTDPSTPSGAYDFGHVLLDDVERIEIVRGAQSTLYGSDAIGGVINIITRRAGPNRFQGYGRIESGSFNTLTEAAGINGTLNRFRYALNIAHSESDGQSITPERLRAGAAADDDGYKNTTLSGHVGFTLPGVTLNFMARHVETRSELDVGSGEDADSESSTRQSVARAEARGSFFGDVWKPLLAVSHTNHVRHNVNERQSTLGDADHTQFIGKRLKVEFQNDIHFGQINSLTLGAETERERMTSSGESVFGSGFGDFIITQNTDTVARTGSIYILDQFAPGKRLRVGAGVRIDDHDSFDPVTTYRVSPIFLIPESATRLKAVYGTGYKAPSLFERYGSSPNNFGTAFFGNPNLLPEESTGWEAGLEQAAWGGRFDGGVTYFSNRFENLIQTVFLPSFDSTAVNIARAETHGGEAFVALRPVDALQLRLDYTYTRTKDNVGLELLRRPRHAAKLDIEQRIAARHKLSVETLYVGERQDVDRVTGLRVTGDDYTLVNLAYAWDLSKHLTVTARVHNLFDREHEPASGFQGLGRGLSVGVRGQL